MDLQPIDPIVLLCAVCLGMRFSSDSSDNNVKHHSTRSSLLESVEQGCYFCKSLWSTAKDTIKNDPAKDFSTTYNINEWGKNGYNLALSSASRDNVLYWSIILKAVLGEADLKSNAESRKSHIKSLLDGKKDKPEAGKAAETPQFKPEQVKAWMEGCGPRDREHFACNPPYHVPYMLPPTRLLDLGGKDSTSFKVILMETAECPSNVAWDDETSKYTSLSYIPKLDPKLVLTETTTSRLLAGCSDTNVDDSIRRAFEITRAIDIRYMWVPSLCVLQDSEDELVHHAAHMCEGYLLSHLNLVDGSIPPKPLAETSDNAFIHQVRNISWSGSSRDYITIHQDWWDHNVDSLPVWKQPNDFAQHFLPGKILYFDHWSGQMLYECRARAGRASSIFPQGIPEIQHGRHRLLHGMLGECLLQTPPEDQAQVDMFDSGPLFELFNWAKDTLGRLVAATEMPGSNSDIPEITSLSLTASTTPRQDDSQAVASIATANPLLRGMAPVARFLRIYLVGPYHSGLPFWKPFFSLTWFVSDNHMPLANLPTKRVVSNPPTPSWSWASVAAPHVLANSGNGWGNITLTTVELSRTDFLGRLLPEQTNSDGRAVCTITSQVLPCSINVQPEGWRHAEFKINGKDVPQGEYRLYPDVKPGVQERKECGLIPLVFQLARGYYNICHCLVVDEEVDGDGDKVYARLGLVTLEDEVVKGIVEPFGLVFTEGGVEVDQEKFQSYPVELNLV